MRHLIWTAPLVAVLALAFSATPAFAWHCPNLAAEAKSVIAAAEAKSHNAALLQEAKDMEAEGEKLHAQGKHNESMEALAKSIKKAVYSVSGGPKSESMGHGYMMEKKEHKEGW